uniref:RNA-directed DNA polymerase n=1 Tax=Anopheles stephensi TaxID=30069 RepID=A0A182YRE5_ANOST
MANRSMGRIGCLLRGIRVYLPAALRKRVLRELHSAHFGVTCTKSLARGYCWRPGINEEIEAMIANCADCQSVRAEPAKMRLLCWKPPSAPFQRVHVDFAGPFMDTYFFIYVDAYSKWPEVQTCKPTTAENTVNMCREIFSKFGIPSILVSDHGVQLTSTVIRILCSYSS